MKNVKWQQRRKYIICPWLRFKFTKHETRKSCGIFKKTASNTTAKMEIRKIMQLRPAKCAHLPLLSLAFKASKTLPCPNLPLRSPGEKKRLSTSRYGFGVSCIIKRSPSEDRALPLPKRKGRDPVPRGASFLKCRCPKTAPRRRKAPKRLAPSLLVTCPSWLARS